MLIALARRSIVIGINYIAHNIIVNNFNRYRLVQISRSVNNCIQCAPMQFILEYAPIILFFAAYKLKDIYFATGVAIAASVLAIAYAWFATRKVSTMQWLSLGIIVIFGGATLLLR